MNRLQSLFCHMLFWEERLVGKLNIVIKLLNPLHTSLNAKRYKSYRIVKDKFCRTIENATLKDWDKYQILWNTGN